MRRAVGMLILAACFLAVPGCTRREERRRCTALLDRKCCQAADVCVDAHTTGNDACGDVEQTTGCGGENGDGIESHVGIVRMVSLESDVILHDPHQRVHRFQANQHE